MKLLPCFGGAALSLLASALIQSVQASIPVLNAGFEDTTGQTVFNEFTFGVPSGWNAHDPGTITGLNNGVVIGTLEPNGTEFFNSTAPEGSRVLILFNDDQLGAGTDSPL